MTETSPLCAIGHPPKDMGDDDEIDWRTRTGRIIPGVELRIVDDSGAERCRGTASRSARSRCAGPWITGVVLRRRRSREVPRRLAAHRRRRLGDAERLRADHRPGQGRHQVGRRVDLVGRAREHAHGPPRRRRGRGDRRARRALGRAAAGVRRAQARLARHRRRAARLARRAHRASSGCRSAGRSSTRCRRPASASSTRRCCAPVTPPTSWRSRSSA